MWGGVFTMSGLEMVFLTWMCLTSGALEIIVRDFTTLLIFKLFQQ